MTQGMATSGAGWRRAGGAPVARIGKRRKRGRRAAGEVAMVDDLEFTSYYGRPIIKSPVWKTPDVPLYLFLGGAAGSSAILGALADVSGRPALTRVSRLVSGGGAVASVGFLIHDLGRPERFLHMLRCSSRRRRCRSAPTSCRRSARPPGRPRRWSCWAGSRG